MNSLQLHTLVTQDNQLGGLSETLARAKTPTGHRAPISGIAAYGGQWVATAGYDNQVILWDAKNQKVLSAQNHEHLANQVSFSHDGKFIVTASSDYTARLWSVPDLKPLAILRGHQDDVEMALFHPSKDLIATASRDALIRIFNLAGEVVHELKGHQADVISLVWSADGNRLLSSSDDGTVRLWDWQNERLLETKSFEGVETDTLIVTRSGLVIAGDDEGRLHLLDGAKNHSIQAHRSGIKRLVWDSFSRRLVSLSYDRRAIVWQENAGTLVKLREISLKPEIWPRSCAFIDEHRLAFATFSSSYEVFDLNAQQWMPSRAQPTPGLNAVAQVKGTRYTIGDAGILFRDGQKMTELGSLCNFLTPVGELLISGGQLGVVFDAFSGNQHYQHRSPLNCAASFCVEGRSYVVVGSYTGEALVFRVEGRVLHFVREAKVFSNAIKGVACSDAEAFFVCANREASRISFAKLLGTKSSGSREGQDSTSLINSAGEFSCENLGAVHDKIANACTFVSEDIFASVSRDLKLRLWHPDGVEEFETPFKHSIKCVAARAGRYIAAACYDGSLAIFDRDKQSWSSRLRPTRSGISSIIAAANGFLASSYDGQVYRVAL